MSHDLYGLIGELDDVIMQDALAVDQQNHSLGEMLGRHLLPGGAAIPPRSIEQPLSGKECRPHLLVVGARRLEVVAELMSERLGKACGRGGYLDLDPSRFGYVARIAIFHITHETQRERCHALETIGKGVGEAIPSRVDEGGDVVRKLLLGHDDLLVATARGEHEEKNDER